MVSSENSWIQRLFWSWLILTFRYDANLSETGVKEAEAGGKALKDAGYKFDVAHTSLLTRANVTLQKVLEAIGQSDLPIEKTWRLNERHYGGKNCQMTILMTEKSNQHLICLSFNRFEQGWNCWKTWWRAGQNLETVFWHSSSCHGERSSILRKYRQRSQICWWTFCWRIPHVWVSEADHWEDFAILE